MKKWTSLLFVVAVMLFLTAKLASAQTVTPKLVLDGKVLNPPEPPALVGSLTMVPVRIVGENLGYQVDYQSESKQVTVRGGQSVIEMTLGQKTATLDGKSVSLQEAPTAKSGTTLIPLRFVGEAFGMQVYWENASKSVYLYSGSKTSDSGDGSANGESGGASSGGDNSGSGDTGSGSSGNDGNGGSGTGATDGSGSAGGTGGGSTGDDGSETDGSNGDAGVGGPIVTLPIANKALVHSVTFDGTDSILIKYDGGFLLPTASVLTAPDRIVVDFPSSDFASDFSPALNVDANANVLPLGELAVTGNDVLQKVRYSRFSDSPSTLRFVLDTSKSWGYAIENDAGTGTLKIKLQDPATMPATNPGQGTYTVVLDAGHGGTDPGAPSAIGKWEKDFTLAVILKLRDALATDKRINVVLTRSSDTYPTLADRYNLANSLGADLFLSVHGNSNPKSSIAGSEVYYTRSESLAFANVVHQFAVPSTGLRDRGVIQKNLAVTRETKMPAVLYEAGYLSNAAEAKTMYTDDFQNKLAQGLAAAIKSYLKLQ